MPAHAPTSSAAGGAAPAGPYHARRVRADGRRDRRLARLGYRVLRIPAALVRERPGEAVALVRAALEA